MKNVWIVKACSTCDDCGKEYYSNNAMALMAKHCKKHRHVGQVTMCYAIHYRELERIPTVGGKK